MIISYLLDRLRDPRTWDRVASTAVQAAVVALTIADFGDAVVVGLLSAAVNLGLVLLPVDGLTTFWEKLAASTARTWLATFAGVALAGTSAINTSVLEAAGVAASAAAIAALKGALIGRHVGDPNDPSIAPAPEADDQGRVG